MRNDSEAGKRGYLRESFRLFHLKDTMAPVFDYHYHEFDKVVLQLVGKVTYNVEGRSYFLKPYDILLVGRNMIHRPIIDPAEPYERMVLWLGGDYLEAHSSSECWLETCFELAERRHFHLLRPRGEDRLRYRDLFERYYPGQARMIKDFWMPNREWEGCDVDDPSARVLKNYGASGF